MNVLILSRILNSMQKMFFMGGLVVINIFVVCWDLCEHALYYEYPLVALVCWHCTQWTVVLGKCIYIFKIVL